MPDKRPAMSSLAKRVVTGSILAVVIVVATLALALDLCDGRYDLDEAHRVYGAMIASTLHPGYGRTAYLYFLKRIGIEFDAEHFPRAGSLFDGVGLFFRRQ